MLHIKVAWQSAIAAHWCPLPPPPSPRSQYVSVRFHWSWRVEGTLSSCSLDSAAQQEVIERWCSVQNPKKTRMCVRINMGHLEWGAEREGAQVGSHPTVLTVKDAWRRVLSDHGAVLLIAVVPAVIQLVADQWAQTQTIPIGAVELALCTVRGREDVGTCKEKRCFSTILFNVLNMSLKGIMFTVWTSVCKQLLYLIFHCNFREQNVLFIQGLQFFFLALKESQKKIDLLLFPLKYWQS